jgi:hypothetical protein
MPSVMYFHQECPTCGRQLRIRVEYLGKPVACQHCQGTFVAAESSSTRDGPVDQGSALLRRANELLDSVAQRQLTGRPPVNR